MPTQEFRELARLCEGDSLALPLLRQRLEASPSGTIQSLDDQHGKTLLHRACASRKVTLAIVEYLVDLFPEAVKVIGTSSSRAPIHVACCNRHCPKDVIEFLVICWPESLTVSDASVGLPLHCLLSRPTGEFDLEKTWKWIKDETTNLDLNLVRFLVDASPEALTNQDNSNSATPALLACERDDISLELIQILVDEDSEALRLTDGRNNEAPLHRIFSDYHLDPEWSRIPLQVVRYMAHAAPDTLDMQAGGSSRETPIHAACRSSYITVEIIKILVEARSRHILMQRENRFGNLPFHTLFCHNHSWRRDKGGTMLQVAHYLLEQYGDAISARNRLGLLPLHYAASTNLELTKFLVKQFPSSVHQVSHHGRLPLQSAFLNGSIEVVEYLHEQCQEALSLGIADLLHVTVKQDRDILEKISFLLARFPDVAKEKDSAGNLPLHGACSSFLPKLDVIKFLFQAYPEAIHTKNNSGLLPIHCLCGVSSIDEQGKKEIDHISFLVTQLPYSVKVKDSEGRLPLHHASQNFSLKGLKHLVRLFPEGVREESSKHGLPIHCACRNRDGPENVKYLQSQYPKSLTLRNETVGLPMECSLVSSTLEYTLMERYAGKANFLHVALADEKIKDRVTFAEKFLHEFDGNAKDVNSLGRFPLHLAVMISSVTQSLVDLLIECHAEAIQAKDKQGSLPLHYALCHNVPNEVVECLLRNHTAASKVADHNGSTPLHLACRHRYPPDIISLLLDAFPTAATLQDQRGCTPVHVASRHGASVAVVKILIASDEAALDIVDHNLELPLHKAARGGHSALVRLLAEKKPTSTGMRNVAGMLPVFLLSQKSGKKDIFAMNDPDFTDAISQLLKAHPEAVKSNKTL